MKEQNKKGRRWENTGAVTTPLGSTQPLKIRKYLRELQTGHRGDIVEELEREGIDLNAVTVYRLFLRGTYNSQELETAIKRLTQDGEAFAVCQVRISGSENQEDNASFPQQERDNVLVALRGHATRLLVVCEIYSAATGSHRGVFARLLRCVRQRQVHLWVASQLDRITRSPSDAVAFVEALQDSSTELRSATHAGPVNPYEALLLMLQFIMAAFHIIAIRSGNARGWRKRLDEGQWPNKGQPLPGMVISPDGRPSWTHAAKQAIPLLFELLDPARGSRGDVNEAWRQVEEAHPRWWADEKEAHPPSEARLKRLISSTAIVNGEQTFEYNGESRKAHFEALGGLVPRDLFERVGRHVLTSEANQRTPCGSWWLRLLRELLSLGHTPAVVLAESDGALTWDADGSLRPVCIKCGPGSLAPLRECDPDFEDLRLADGRVRHRLRVPAFRCEGCNSSTRPLQLRALRLLLARCRRLICLRCGSHDVEVALRDPAPVRVTFEVVSVRCRTCAQRFWFDPQHASPVERYRYFAAGLPRPRRVQFRPEADLGRFSEGEA